MLKIPEDILSKFSDLQAQIWQTVSLTVSEAANQAITFSSPVITSTRPSETFGELMEPMMVIQFSFASQPEDCQVILVPQETVLSLVEVVQGTSVDEIDENIVADLRAPMEAIVQGICLAVGNIKNEAMVASGLSIRFQIFSSPLNLQQADYFARAQIALTGDDLNGTLTWLLATESIHEILGLRIIEEDDLPGFPQMGASSDQSAAPARTVNPLEDHKGLDLLYDIPLEISVELGRVKMLVREVVELGSGSIVEIDKAAGEPVDVMVNGRLVARGEVVVIEDNFGVRITEILNPHERAARITEAA